MKGYLAIVLHAHLPFVRHPEHESFLEENWLFEAITETYLPLIRLLKAWHRDGMDTPLTLTLTPTLCTMLSDPLLQERYRCYLNRLIELAEKEIHRTHWEKHFHDLAVFYDERFRVLRELYAECRGNLTDVFRELQDLGRIEIITSAATHAVLPLLAGHPPSVRAQILVARDHFRACFGRDPKGIWLPECAYFEGLEAFLHEAGIRWFITDTNGILHARPRPRYAMFAPILTPSGVAAFGRDRESAKQVWSRDEGYPGDSRYRDFYRDIGFDLDLDYLRPHLSAPARRGFTGIKYHRITDRSKKKEIYARQPALEAADSHATHFLQARAAQIEQLAEILHRPPLVLSPYDAELFGHWWYEGPEFLDLFMRKAWFDQQVVRLTTPEVYLRENPMIQIASPAASSWGEAGYWSVWLNEKNQWIYPHLRVAQERMSELARRFTSGGTAGAGESSAGVPKTPMPTLDNPAYLKSGSLPDRALKQAARELLLAQASDWPFILRTGTSPEYATQRIKDHLLRFTTLYEQLVKNELDEQLIARIEQQDNIFPDIDFQYWR